MGRKSARSLPSFSASRRLDRRRGFRPAVSRLEERTLLSLNPTFTSVVASVGKVGYGQPVTFTATVSELPPAGVIPTGGTVTFYEGTTWGDRPAERGNGGLHHHLTAGGRADDHGGLQRRRAELRRKWFGDDRDGCGRRLRSRDQHRGAHGRRGARRLPPSWVASATWRWMAGAICSYSTGTRFARCCRAESSSPWSATYPPVTPRMTARPTTSTRKGPGGLAVGMQGDLFIAVGNDSVVREVKATDSNGVPSISPSSPIITVAGDGTAGYSGDGGQATDAQLRPGGVAVDARGDLFIADSFNNVVRQVTPGPDGSLADGTITTVAGNGYGAGILGFVTWRGLHRGWRTGESRRDGLPRCRCIGRPGRPLHRRLE